MSIPARRRSRGVLTALAIVCTVAAGTFTVTASPALAANTTRMAVKVSAKCPPRPVAKGVQPRCTRTVMMPLVNATCYVPGYAMAKYDIAELLPQTTSSSIGQDSVWGFLHVKNATRGVVYHVKVVKVSANGRNSKYCNPSTVQFVKKWN